MPASKGATIFRRPTDSQVPHTRPIFPHDRNQDVTNPLRWGSAFLNRTAAAWDSDHFVPNASPPASQRSEAGSTCPLGNHRPSRPTSSASQNSMGAHPRWAADASNTHGGLGQIPLPKKFDRVK
ncbi:unnamed protein product [Amoebophrya sp. A25]|nr:unnamed protein product [Amoebophrya sp. A25]|eukprot:GSA25T00009737001.1